MRKTTVLSASLLLLSFVAIESALAQWVKMDSLGGLVSSFAAADWGYIFAGTYGSGIFRSGDNGNTWATADMTYHFVNVLAVNSSYLCAGTEGGGVYRSTDSGLSWTPVNNGLTNLYIEAFAVLNSNLFAIATGGTGQGVFFRSTDSGASWTAPSGILPGSPQALAVMGGNLFVGTRTGGIFRSADSGATWTAMNNSMSSICITAFAVSGNRLFAGASPTNSPSATPGGIYRSIDNGDSWVAVNTGLTSSIVSSFAASGNNIFAGTTEAGLFLTTNNGDLWTSVNTGLTETNITALGVSNDYLFAGTYGGNIWRRQISEMVAVKYAQNTQKPQKAVDLYVDRNNNLRYTLAEAATVSLKVYDMRGRVIHSSIVGRQQSGFYSLPLSAGRISAGNYVVDFTAGDFRIQRLFMVI